MAYETLRNIAYDVLTDLKQINDDRDIQLSQAVYWITVVGNNLKSKHIAKRDSGQFLSTFIVPVQEARNNSTANLIMGRKYIEIPSSVYDFDGDKGIDFICYYDIKSQDGISHAYKRTFHRATAKTLQRYYMNPYEAPKPSTPVFHRSGDFVYLVGIESVGIKTVEVGLYKTFDPITKIDIDQPFEFPSELIEVLKRQVIDLGRFALLIPEERKNTGSDDTNAKDIPGMKVAAENMQQKNEQ